MPKAWWEEKKAWSDELVQKVWEKGKVIVGQDPKLSRRDECGAKILRSRYADRDSVYGWEIDHIKPESQGGSDDLSNLRPLQWENNVATGDTGHLVCDRTG